MHRKPFFSFLVLILSCALHSETKSFSFSNEELSFFNIENDQLVGGVINPISGQPSLKVTDFLIKGAQNIALERIYLPSIVPEKFDKDGNPVRDIDFTDHGRPHLHPNPHQHTHNPNETGGTPERNPVEPVVGWGY